MSFISTHSQFISKDSKKSIVFSEKMAKLRIAINETLVEPSTNVHFLVPRLSPLIRPAFIAAEPDGISIGDKEESQMHPDIRTFSIMQREYKSSCIIWTPWK